MAVVINGTTGIDKVQDGSIGTVDLAADAVTAAKLDVGQIGGRRNLIINGAMQHWQRGTSNTSVSDGQYLVDRFGMRTSNNGWYRADQDSSAPAGFPYSLKITSLGSNTPASGAYIFLSQKIEGFNSFNLSYGTSSAKTTTVSFYVRSSITGTHGGSIRNSAQNRSYPFSYTINSADTWEHKEITIPGDTTGTWIGATNGIGLEIMWNLGSGSANIGTSGSWAAAGYLGATGEVNIVETSGATLYITGVQLEVGDTATPFEHRSYGEELTLCHRYFERLTYSNTQFVSIGVANTTTTANTMLSYLPKRASPTITLPAAGTSGGALAFLTSTGGYPSGIGSLSIQLPSATGLARIHGSGFSGLNNGSPSGLFTSGSSSISIDAEI